MKPKLLNPELFPYERFLAVREKRNQFIYEWAHDLCSREVPVLIYPPQGFLVNNNTCADRELFLRGNLWAMATSCEWFSDGIFPHLMPWYGVGIYASAFGCRYIWKGSDAPQVRPIYTSIDGVANITTPDPRDSREMQEVLRRIRWYRKITRDRLPICLTDTQSPNNAASLILEVNEFFAISILNLND